MAKDVLDSGECGAEEESDLLPAYQRWQNTCGRDSHFQGDHVQKKGCCFHLAIRVTSAGKGESNEKT